MCKSRGRFRVGADRKTHAYVFEDTSFICTHTETFIHENTLQHTLQHAPKQARVEGDAAAASESPSHHDSQTFLYVHTLHRQKHTATHCNTLQHTATRCNTQSLQHSVTTGRHLCICTLFTDRNTLQHTASHCNTMQHTATHCNALFTDRNTLQHTATHCNTQSLQHSITIGRHSCICTLKQTRKHENTLQHTATHCNTLTLQHTVTHYNTQQLTATHCYKLLHTATHCNTL